MQDHIWRHMGSRNLSSINNDMTKILVENFGTGWGEALPYYMDAVNWMDQGVPAASANKAQRWKNDIQQEAVDNQRRAIRLHVL